MSVHQQSIGNYNSLCLLSSNFLDKLQTTTHRHLTFPTAKTLPDMPWVHPVKHTVNTILRFTSESPGWSVTPCPGTLEGHEWKLLRSTDPFSFRPNSIPAGYLCTQRARHRAWDGPDYQFYQNHLPVWVERISSIFVSAGGRRKQLRPFPVDLLFLAALESVRI